MAPITLNYSILGTAYHDLLGNADNLKIRANWPDIGKEGILPWAGLYYQ